VAQGLNERKRQIEKMNDIWDLQRTMTNIDWDMVKQRPDEENSLILPTRQLGNSQCRQPA